MEEEIQEKLNALLKYVPFIDFIVDIDKEKYAKFIEIKKWILNKKRFPLSDLNKIEKSLITQYKNLITIADKKIPKEIIQIFINEFKHQFVDLCSDEEDNVKDKQQRSPLGTKNTDQTIDSDDDLEIVSISYLEKEKKKAGPKAQPIEKRADPYRGAPPNKEKSRIVIDALDDTSAELLRQIDQLSTEEMQYADPHIYHENSDDEEKLFKRRNQSIFKRREEFQDNDNGFKKEIQIESNNRSNISKVAPSTLLDTISLDSSDDDTPESAVDIKSNAFSVTAQTTTVAKREQSVNRNTSTEKSTRGMSQNPANMDIFTKADLDLNDTIATQDKPSNISIRKHEQTDKKTTDNKQIVQPASKATDITNIEKLSVEELMSCTLANDEKKGANVEKLLTELIKKLLQKISTEPETPPPPPHLNGLHNLSPTTLTAPAPAPVPQNENPPIAVVSQVYSNLSLPQSSPPLAYGYQNPTLTNNEGYFSTFQTLANQRRLNLSDPRIRNELNKYKNSPLLAAGGIDIANLGNSISQTVPSYVQDNHLRPPIVNNPRVPLSIQQYCQTNAFNQPLNQNCRFPSRPQNANVRTFSNYTSSTKSKINYGEYKRRMAEKQRQENTSKERAAANDQYINYGNYEIPKGTGEKATQEKNPNENVETREFQKRAEEIRSVLLNTLQPYTSKLEAMWELHNKPENETVNKKNENLPLNEVNKTKIGQKDKTNGHDEEVPTNLDKNAENYKPKKAPPVEGNGKLSPKNKSKKDSDHRSKGPVQRSKDTIQKSKDTIQKSKDPIEKSKDSIEKSKDPIEKSKENMGKNDKVSRLLKSLDYSSKNCVQTEDYTSVGPIGCKRRSSVHARSAIAKQLNAERGGDCAEELNVDSSSSPKYQTSPVNITKRRKTTDEMPKTLLRKRRQSIHTPTGEREQIQYSTNNSKNKGRRKTIDEPPPITVNLHTDSESEGNDFELFRLNKMKKLKEDVSKQIQPSIVLKRLSDSEIRNYTTTKCQEKPPTAAGEDNMLSVLLVESNSQRDSQDITAAAKGPKNAKKVKPKRANNDCQMTEANTKLCVLCTSRPSDLTNHYVQKHKSESYTSRLNWSQLDDIRQNTPLAKELPNTNGRVIRRYAVTCPFCREELNETFMNLYNHYSTHTGEYAFQCLSCKLEKPFRADIQSHQLHAKKCRSSNVQTMYRYPSNTMAIYLHYCTICNFVQLNEANVLRHLRDHHEPRQSDANNVQKCILAAIHDGSETDNDSDQQTPLASNQNERRESNDVNQSCSSQTESTTEDIVAAMNIDDDIPVENEAFSEEQHDAAMHDLEEQLKLMQGDASVMTVVHGNPQHTVNDIASTPLRLESSEEISNICKSEPIEEIEDDCVINICKPEPIEEEEEDNRPSTPQRPSLQRFTTNRYLQNYRSYPANVKYLGLYKCLSDDCYYSTDSSYEYLQHLEDHQCENVSELQLTCAYCNVFEEEEGSCSASSQQLVDHIEKKHLHMIYQCSACCYRSCEASNVLVHQAESHNSSSQTCVIYKCSGIERPVDAAYVKNKMMGNIRKLTCTYCSHKSFYHSNLLENHLKVDHRSHDVHQRRLQHYSCIYCHFTEKDKSVIRKHLCIVHPEEMPYICDHSNCVSENEDLLHNLKSISLIQVVPVIDVNACKSHVEDPLEDVKPNVEELMKLHEETMKVRLVKLTRKTGIAPDYLYHCPEKSCGGFFSIYDLWLRHMRAKHHCLECQCPHCPTETTRSLNDYREHFEKHRRHTYLCFHCPLTFVNRQDANEHFSRCHSSLGAMRLEQFRHNISYSYFVAIQRELLSQRAELIPVLLDTLKHNLKELEYKDAKKLKRSWLASPQSAPWLIEYINNVSSPTLYICGACSQHYTYRNNLANHIREEHAARDVPILNVFRNDHGKWHHTLELVFANERLSFSTMRNCFCCEERGMNSDVFILHLKRYHKFVLHYICEWCNVPIESLDSVDKHFRQCHAAIKLKIRCELSHEGEISVVSMRHLKVHLAGEREFSLATVKQEPAEHNSNIDDSVMLMENDDIVLENHVRQLESIKDYSAKPKLKCIAVENLLKTTVEELHPQSTTFPQCTQVVNSVDGRMLPRKKFVQPRYVTPTTSGINTGMAHQVLTTSPTPNTIASSIPTNSILASHVYQHSQPVPSTKTPTANIANISIASNDKHNYHLHANKIVRPMPQPPISRSTTTVAQTHTHRSGDIPENIQSIPIIITTSAAPPQYNPYHTLATSFLNTHLTDPTTNTTINTIQQTTNAARQQYIYKIPATTSSTSVTSVYGRITSYDLTNK